ncbi:uncharacterized protein LOC112351318 [Selaginella moellendorffii]|uniref:uncharacterized protein LOC112351318 n=1 Tax=Selaginella moellendorffii TaxID=88036 RepID=UPI000D1CE069|nr:uncharacterized protein LOC112351318 [Selaginella moellendorffii]|eukprot:XP_024544744.1 uncharacterized protein LOC112351318 [Selaginella moellendorffii]
MAVGAYCAAPSSSIVISSGNRLKRYGFSQAGPVNRAIGKQGLILQVAAAPLWGLGFSGRRRRDAARLCQSQCSMQVQELEHRQILSVEQCLEKMREAMGIDDIAGNEQFTVTGEQTFMGLTGEWNLSWSSDGRFYEKFDSEEVTVDGGYDGTSRPWHADYAGRVTSLDLDDLETSLLTTWLRTGFWISAGGQTKLSIELDKDSPSEKIFEVHLKDSKVLARVHVDTDTWLPTQMRTQVFGGEDVWEYSDWRCILPGRRYRMPCSTVRYPPAGGKDTTIASRAEAARISQSLFTVPSTPQIARHNKRRPVVEFDEDISSTVKMIQTVSGHYVVKPLIDGQDIGYFVVDTGASGLSLAPGVGERFSMAEFGEIYVTGVETQVKSKFVRGREFQLGRLKITNPLYIEVAMDGVVRGVQPVAGICGFDLFYHCVVEMSMTQKTLSLFNAATYQFPKNQSFVRMRMLENVPHVPAKFNGHETLFLLDTGAGGVDVIFPNSTVEKYKLLEGNSNSFLEAKVKGVNASSGIQALYGTLPSFELGDHVFKNIKALFFKGEGGMVSFSAYTGGILCEQLLRSFVLVMDYQRCRVAFVASKDRQSLENGRS